jgi:chorismate mutase/prephenate dehydratase
MKKIIGPNLHQKLIEKRKEIDLIDRKLLSLLNQRLRIALGIGKIKREMGGEIYNPEREKEVLGSLKVKNRGPLKEEDIKKIFRTIMKICRKSQT